MDQSAVEQLKARAMELDGEALRAFEQQDFSRARQLFQQALDACRMADWNEEIIYGLLHVTQAMAFEPDYDPANAHPLLEEALQVARQIGTDRYIIPVQINRLRISIDEGRAAEALRLAQENLRRAVEISDQDLVFNLLTWNGIASAALGQAEAALRLYGCTEAERTRRGQKLIEPFLSSHARRFAPARKSLSPERQAELEAEGRGLSFEEAVILALSIPVPE